MAGNQDHLRTPRLRRSPKLKTKTMNQSHPDPPADIEIERIGDLLNYELPALRAAGQTGNPEASAIPTN